MYQLPTISYHGHHSPMGARSSFTLGRLVQLAAAREGAAAVARFMGVSISFRIMNSFPFFKDMENERSVLFSRTNVV